jgi:uncharacterized protein DUF5335
MEGSTRGTGTASASEAARVLDPSEWSSYFHELNRRIEHGTDLEASIEVTGEDVDGTEAEHLPLDGITWEHHDDQIAIGLGGRGRRYPAVLWHFVDHPRQVWLRENEGLPVSLGIESEDGTYTFVRVRPAR